MISTIQDICKQLAEEEDKLLYSLFAKHGYHRGKVLKLAQKKRICKVVAGNIEHYSVDGKYLFSTEKLVVFDDEHKKARYIIREYTGGENNEQLS